MKAGADIITIDPELHQLPDSVADGLDSYVIEESAGSTDLIPEGHLVVDMEQAVSAAAEAEVPVDPEEPDLDAVQVSITGGPQVVPRSLGDMVLRDEATQQGRTDTEDSAIEVLAANQREQNRAGKQPAARADAANDGHREQPPKDASGGGGSGDNDRHAPPAGDDDEPVDGYPSNRPEDVQIKDDLGRWLIEDPGISGGIDLSELPADEAEEVTRLREQLVREGMPPEPRKHSAYPSRLESAHARAERALTSRNNEEPTEDEVVEHLQERHPVRSHQEVLATYGRQVSLETAQEDHDRPRADDGSIDPDEVVGATEPGLAELWKEIASIPANKADDPESQAMEQRLMAAIARAVERLRETAPRPAEVVGIYYGLQGKEAVASFVAIGRILGITQQRVGEALRSAHLHLMRNQELHSFVLGNGEPDQSQRLAYSPTDEQTFSGIMPTYDYENLPGELAWATGVSNRKWLGDKIDALEAHISRTLRKTVALRYIAEWASPVGYEIDGEFHEELPEGVSMEDVQRVFDPNQLRAAELWLRQRRVEEEVVALSTMRRRIAERPMAEQSLAARKASLLVVDSRMAAMRSFSKILGKRASEFAQTAGDYPMHITYRDLG